MITRIAVSHLMLVMSTLSACGVPDSPSPRVPSAGPTQGAKGSDCATATDEGTELKLVNKTVADDSAGLEKGKSNCLPNKKPTVATANKSGTTVTSANNLQAGSGNVTPSSNIGTSASNSSPFSNSGLSGGLSGLAGGLGGLSGLAGGLGGLTSGLGGLTGGLGGLSGLSGLAGGLGGLSGLAGGLGGLTSGLGGLTGGLGNLGNLGSLFGGGGGQSGGGAGSVINSAAANNVNTPATVSGSATYSANVSSYLNQACVRCHAYLGNYDGAKRSASDSLSRMKSGNMPPGGGVSSADMSMFQAWVNAGEPE